MNEATLYVQSDAREPAVSLCARFGHHLRSLRLSKRRSLTEFASETGISVALLEQVESGLHEPDLPLLSQLASALDLTLSELLAEL